MIYKNNIKVFALGGLGEVGKNMYVIEQNDELLIIDSGILFPDDNYGVSDIIPDYTYLKQNEEKIQGLFITHGHEDHIGGIPFLLSQIKIPKVYASGLALGLIKNKMSEFARTNINLEEYNENSIYKFKNFTVSFFRTNHSIPDSFGIAIKTNCGYILHTGDFKFDFTPIGAQTDYAKITKYSEEGVQLLLSDSTNALVNNFTQSEKKVSKSILNILSQIKGRVIIATFASNVYRVQQIVEASIKCNRKIIVFGRSMEKTINVGQQLKYIKAPVGTFISVKDLPLYPPNRITILSTGTQGEPLAALSRIATGTHKHIKIIPNDTIIFSSSAIPGNQEDINKTINLLYHAGANVIINSPLTDTHTSGHASSSELQLMLCLARPKYFMPIHGEYIMQKRHIELAVETGIKRENCFILENGDILNLSYNKAEVKGKVTAGDVFIDNNNSIIDNNIIRERKLMSDEGLVSIVFIVKHNRLIANPKILSRGFIYMNSSVELINSIETKAINAFKAYALSHKIFNSVTFKKYVTNELINFIYQKTEKKPLVIPIIMKAEK